MIDQVQPCCGDCQFFVRHPTVLQMGQCIHSPPVAIVTAQGVTSMFPPVAIETRCAQFKAAGEGDGQAPGQGNGRLLING